MSYDDRRLDAAREVGRPVAITLVDPNAVHPDSTTRKRGRTNSGSACGAHGTGSTGYPYRTMDAVNGEAGSAGMWWRQEATEKVTDMADSPIVALWCQGKLPIEDAIHYAGGVSRELDVHPQAPGGFELGDEFDLAEMLAEDPDWVSDVDITNETAIHGGFLVRGEGSHGSEGFFGRLDAGRELVWIVFLAESNPFVETTVNGDLATFTSSSGVSITVHIDWLTETSSAAHGA
ncbi:hypothetical protein [Amycolatopsis sp. NPDC059657]|uniref:hypothetical protein n=1 Tax=Amycolatopsis sp. NPDC059657 TaxID=3346899 RepID=UPI00366E184D